MPEYILTSRRWRVYLLILGLLGVTAWASIAVAGVAATDLRCELLTDPQGIDTTKPRLSWVLKAGARAQSQFAYQVLVASSEARLAAEKGDLWDSGKVVSSQSVLVPYGGKPLGSHAECFWKIRVWSDEKAVSGWSEPAKWTMGILKS